MVTSISFRVFCNLIVTLLLTALHICSTQGEGLLDDLRLIALDTSTSCDNVGDFGEFIGGASFFQDRFQSLYESVLQATQTINRLDVSLSLPPPKDDVYDATTPIHALVESRNLIDLQVLMGSQTESLVNCFKDGSYAACGDEQDSLYLATASSWSFRRYCNKWSAIYTAVQTRLLDETDFIKTIVLVEIDISSEKINQCATYIEDEFADTNLCPSNTQCISNPHAGFQVESYSCKCDDCETCSEIPGRTLLSYLKTNETESYTKQACIEKPEIRNQLIQWRKPRQPLVIMLAVNGLCVLLCIILAIVVVFYRESKSILSAKPLILELILIGAIIIYASLLLRCFTVAVLVCMLGSWLREVAFICIYGAIVLKTYKGLAEFQTRKARRVHVRDKDLLKYWFSMLAIVIIYMSAWSAINIHFINDGYNMLRSAGHSYICGTTAWNYVTSASELLLLAIGLYMSYRLRSASSLFWESRFFAAAFFVEFVISLIYYILSDRFDLLYFDWIPFIHIHLTITPVLLLIFVPKLHFIRHPPPDSAFYGSKCNNTDLVDFRTPNKSPTTANNGEVDIEDINIAEMSSEDIRRELRRVYEQLQMYKVKVMRYENPHIQHKRGQNRGKIPFYKQITKRGISKKHREDDQNETHDAAVSENPEEVPLTSVIPADQAASF